MAAFAKRLPILFVPEQFFVAPVRNDMVNNRGRRQLAIFSAFRAERILFKKQRPGRAPFAVITSLGSVLPGIQLAMCFAVYAVREVRTARMPAWPLRFSGHMLTSQHQQSSVVVHRIAGIQVLHSPVKCHDEGNRAVHLLGGFFFVQL